MQEEYDVTILCLANSRKPPSGRCIAGKVIEDDELTQTWIRPVSERVTHEVSEEERRYEEGTKAQLLDLVRVPLKQPDPAGHQVENHVLDDRYYWAKEGTASWDLVRAAVDPYDADFWVSGQSTYHGLHDKVSEADVQNIASSLKLVLVPELTISVKSESGFEDNPARRRVRGKLALNGVRYWLSITDPEVEESYLVRGDGEYEIGEAALCVSLVEVWNGFAFRVIASVITPERCTQPDDA